MFARVVGVVAAIVAIYGAGWGTHSHFYGQEHTAEVGRLGGVNDSLVTKIALQETCIDSLSSELAEFRTTFSNNVLDIRNDRINQLLVDYLAEISTHPRTKRNRYHGVDLIMKRAREDANATPGGKYADVSYYPRENIEERLDILRKANVIRLFKPDDPETRLYRPLNSREFKVFRGAK